MLLQDLLAAVFSFGSSCGQAHANDSRPANYSQIPSALLQSTDPGGVLRDIWAPKELGTAIVLDAFAVTGGPVNLVERLCRANCVENG